jgi:hypothetical protein
MTRSSCAVVASALKVGSALELGFRVANSFVFVSGLDNRVLRRIFGPKRNEVTGDWRKLHNEELHNLYY